MKLYVRKVPDKKWAVRWTGCTEKQGKRFCKKHGFQYVSMYNSILCFSTSIYKNVTIQRGDWIVLSGDAPVIDKIFPTGELINYKNSSYDLTTYANAKFKKN